MNNKNLLELVLKWKVHLVIIAVIAGVISILFSGPQFIKPKFKSFSVVYPTNLGEYSEESYTEQMMEIFNSGDIRDHLIEAFNLDDHYKISPDYKYYRTALFTKYADHVSFRKTENEAVKIEVLDTDPQVASDMVDSLISFYDQKVKQMHNVKFREELDVRKAELERQHNTIDTLQSKLIELGSKYGVMESSGQSEGLSASYFAMLAEGRGSTEGGKELRKYFMDISARSPEYQGLFLEIESYYKLLGETEIKYNDAYREYTKSITYSVVITPPYPADKKFWPKRSVIVLGSVILTLILALIVIGTIENRNNNKAS